MMSSSARDRPGASSPIGSAATLAVEASLPRAADFNTGGNEAVGYFEVNQRHGLRWNAAKALLRPPAKVPPYGLDSRLRVRNIDGLSVVNAGIMPAITGGNTNAPPMMTAETAVGWIGNGAARED